MGPVQWVAIEIAARSSSEVTARAVRTNQERTGPDQTFAIHLAEFDPKFGRISS
jgi:hypothetical protein